MLSVTVVGPTLALADAYATAAFAMGEAGLEWVARQPGYGALAITTERPRRLDAAGRRAAPRRLTQPIELDAVPAEGEIVDVTATGDLTLHGVTKAVEIPLEARLEGGVISVAGSLPIQFADYNIAQPQGMIVLSVEDHGVLELQLHFTRA